jgi:hypothetical protein
MKFALLTWMMVSALYAIEPSESIDGEWIVRENQPKIPKLQVNIDSMNKKVSLTVPKDAKGSQSVNFTFLDSAGHRTSIEMKAMDVPSFPARYYEGQITNAASFVGFEIKIPLYSNRPTVVRSRQMHKVRPH